MLDELIYHKGTTGLYVVTDRQGRSATGVTKEIAKNQYYLLYGMKKPSVNIPNIKQVTSEIMKNIK